MEKESRSTRIGSNAKIPPRNKNKSKSNSFNHEITSPHLIKEDISSNINAKANENDHQENNNNEFELNSFHQSGMPLLNENKQSSVQKDKDNRDELKKRLTNINVNLNPNESIAKNYSTLYTIMKPLRGIRPKKISLYEVKYFIEEIYSVCILKHTKCLKEQFAKGIDSPSMEAFPTFVYQFIANKYIKKAIIDQTLLNILLSIDYFRPKDDDIDIFSKFISEEYTDEDLLLYLFTRSAIEKELKVLFLEKAKDEIKIQHMEERDEIFTVLYVNTRTLSRSKSLNILMQFLSFVVVATVFASDDECLVNTFIKRLEPLMEKNVQSNHYNTLTTTQLLKTVVDDFHSSRQIYPECKGIGSVPFASSKQNEFFDNVIETDEHNLNNDSNSYANLMNYFTNQPGDKIDNIKEVLLIYLKEKEIAIFFEKYYSGELNMGGDGTLFEIRDLVLKKLYFLIHFIFYEDEQSWNASLGVDNFTNDTFANLASLKERLLSVSSISELNEPIIEAFCASLLSTPLLLNQISKIINSKRQL